MLNPKIFCPLPFVQAVVRTDGRIGPCCNNGNISNIKQTTLIQYWNSNKLSHFKKQILENSENVAGCEKCYIDEKLTGSSMRTDALNDHKFVKHEYYHKIFKFLNYDTLEFPQIVEMHFGNLCNLKCLTCRPSDSSKFLSENKILKISNENQKDFELEEKDILDNLNLVFEHSKKIDLRGGESLLVPEIKKFLTNLDEAKINDKILRIQTNGSILDPEWIKIFKKFKSLEIMLSIDSINKEIEYMRFPVKWNQITANLKEFKKLNCKLYINCTVSNLNILNLNKLLDWSEQNELYVHLSFLNDPVYYQFVNLPQDLLNSAIVKLEPYFSKYPNLKAAMEKAVSNTKEWEIFCQIIDKRDKYRNNSIFKILPELQEYWHAKTK